MTVYTIGHSMRTMEELVSLLGSFNISILADIRTIPRSRHNPQFNADALSSALRGRGLRYVHLPRLGGLRHTRKDSPNTGWRNASFRGFADYMLTAEFEAGLAELRSWTAEGPVALMCAEAVPWRCHRSLIADSLTARGARVEHITGEGHSSLHHVTSFARLAGGRVTYPGQASVDDVLAVKAPFHLEATVRVLQRRPANLVDVWQEGAYRRVVCTQERLVLTQVRNYGTVDDPDVRLSIRADDASPPMLAGTARILRTTLGLDVDPLPPGRLRPREKALRPTLLALRGMRPPRFADLFETFANVVPFQQVSVDSGVATVGRLVRRFGRHIEIDGQHFYAFPHAGTIAETSVAALRDCGMSRRKAESLRRLAEMIASGDLSEDTLSVMQSEEAVAYLEKLPGIGPWSAALVLLRGLGRLDVFPRGDAGVARAFATLLDLRPDTSLDSIVERLGNRRGYFYFCAVADRLLARGLIHEAPPGRTQKGS